MSQFKRAFQSTGQRYHVGILKLMESAERSDIEGEVKKYNKTVKHLVRRCEPFMPTTVKDLLRSNFKKLNQEIEEIEKKKLGTNERSNEILKVEYLFYDTAFLLCQKVMNNSPIISKRGDAITNVGKTMKELKGVAALVRHNKDVKISFFEETED